MGWAHVGEELGDDARLCDDLVDDTIGVLDTWHESSLDMTLAVDQTCQKCLTHRVDLQVPRLSWFGKVDDDLLIW